MFDEYRVKGVNVKFNLTSPGKVHDYFRELKVEVGISETFIHKDKEILYPAKVLHIPVSVGAVGVVYNLPGVDTLKLSSEALNGIFSGVIHNWNDSLIQVSNPTVKMPKQEIKVLVRNDASTSNALLTDYLAKINESFVEEIGIGTVSNWPAQNVAVQGVEQMLTGIKNVEGALGYIDVGTATRESLAIAELQNKSEFYVPLNLESMYKAVDAELPADTKVSITNSESLRGYPICGITWMMVYLEQNYNNRTIENAKDLAKLLWWMTHEGQRFVLLENQLPLTSKLTFRAEQMIYSMSYDNKPVFIKNKDHNNNDELDL